jgi:predicted permease
MFRNARGIAAGAIVSLAIGIGANTAVFSVFNALLLRPLPYAHPERLTILWNRSPGLNIEEDWFSTAQYFDIKEGHGGFETVALAIGAAFNLTGGGDPERVGVMRVSANLLPMLGAVPLHGQLLAEDDDQPGRPQTAVLSHGFFARRFGADPGVVGSAIELNGVITRIVGVLPRGFRLPREVLPTLGVIDEGEIFLPLPLAPDAASIRTREDYNILARLKPGVELAAAQAEMDALTARLRKDFPEAYPPHGGLTFSIVPLQEEVVGDVRRLLLVLTGAVALVLLIACANVSNLLLSHAMARRRELAIRSALGATRGRIVRQLLGESLALAATGAALGTLLAWAGVNWLQAMQPQNVPRLAEIQIDGRVLLFAVLVTAVAGLLASLAPALSLGRVDLQQTLGGVTRGGSAAGALWGRGGTLRRTLVVTQLVLAVVLLVGAGLLIRTSAHLISVPTGFDSRGVTTFELTLTGARYPNGPAVLQGYQSIWESLGRVPGVTELGGISALPLSGHFSWGPITVDGRVPPPGENFINVDQRMVGARYFEAMRIPLVSGRYFGSNDIAGAPLVVIVDERMARDLWPGEDAIGKRIRPGDLKSTSPWRTVIGVVPSVAQYQLGQEGRMAMYVPHTQAPTRALYVTVRSDLPADAMMPCIRRAVADVDPKIPVHRLRPMTALVDASLAQHRFAMRGLSIFALVALILAAIGTYGVLAYLVAQGRREIGIRLALGATPRQVQQLVVGHALRVGGTGLILGAAAAAVLARGAGHLVHGVSTFDVATYSVVTAVFGVVIFAAGFIPARRAARVDPRIVLDGAPGL